MDDNERPRRIREARQFADLVRASASQLRRVQESTPSSSVALALEEVIAAADGQVREAEATADRLAAGLEA